MKDILKKVNCSFTDDELKQMINHFALNKNSSVYEYFRSETRDENTKKCEGMDEFLIELFEQYKQDLIKSEKEDNDVFSMQSEDELIKNIDTANIKNIRDLFVLENFKRIVKKPFWPQDKNDNSRFVHITNNCLKHMEDELHECRLYLSPEMKNIIPIVKLIMEKHSENNISCHLKFNTNSLDNDRIILYSSLENISKHLEIINQIKEEYEELFHNMGNNKLWGKIEGYSDVFFGMEPFMFEYNSSYNSIRTTIIDQVLLDFFDKYNVENIEQITDEMLTFFKGRLKLYSLVNNINPYNFCLNMENDKNHKTPIRLYGDKNTSLSIAINYIFPDDDSVVISARKYSLDDYKFLSISKDELEFLYRKDEDNNDYDKSNQIRKDIYNKLEKLHKKNKIATVLNMRKPKVEKSIRRIYNTNELMNNCCINYNLYRLLPQKASELLCLLKLRDENKKMGIVSIKNMTEISSLMDEITNNDPKEVEAVMSAIEEINLDGDLNKTPQNKSLIKKL